MCTHNVQTMREKANKVDKFDFIKIKNVCSIRDTMNKIKIQVTAWEVYKVCNQPRVTFRICILQQKNNPVDKNKKIKEWVIHRSEALDS